MEGYLSKDIFLEIFSGFFCFSDTFSVKLITSHFSLKVEMNKVWINVKLIGSFSFSYIGCMLVAPNTNVQKFYI